MAVRTGMVGLVSYLREYGNTATDEVWNGVTYWTDDQLQTVADEDLEYRTEQLNVLNIDSTLFAIDLPSYWYLESDTFSLLDADGNVIDSGLYTYDEDRRLFTFDPAYEDDVYISGYFYHKIKILANLWLLKAVQRQHFVDMKAGAQQLKLKQEYDHCLKMSELYRSRIIKSWARKGAKVRRYVGY